MRRAFIFLVLALVALQASAQEAAPPPNLWATSLGAGLAITSGNSDTKNLNFSFTTKYDPKSNVLFKAEALYLRGEANGVTQTDKASANARGEYSFSDRVFTFGELTYLRDPFKDITCFVAPLIGAGYHLIKTDAQTLTVDAAAGAQTESGSAGRSSSGAVKAGQSFDWTISKSSKLTQRLSGIWKSSDFADALYHFDAGLTTTVSTHTDLKLAYVYDYKSRPTAPGIVKGDSALVAALLLKF